MAGDRVFHVVCAEREVAFSYVFVPVGCKFIFVSLGWMMHLLAWLVSFWELKFWIAEEGFPLRLLDTLSVLFLSEHQGLFFFSFPFLVLLFSLPLFLACQMVVSSFLLLKRTSRCLF